VTERHWQDRWRVAPLDWSPAYATPEDFDALYALEAMTNDRLRTELGELDLVPREERRFGPGYGPIMAALTHLNPLGSRFSDGSYGVFYCARSRVTAIAETRYHTGQFLAATAEAPMRQQMRLYTVIASGEVVDLRNDPSLDAAILSPHDYLSGQSLGRAVRAAGAPGIAYPSVRDPGGECLAAFRPALLRGCHHAAYLEYNWNGSVVDMVFELNQVG
jgi:hypothetical protein